MRCVSYNVQFGMGLDGRFDLERIARSLDGADVIALQEVTRAFAPNGGIDMVAAFESLFPAFHTAYHAPVDVFLDSTVTEGRRVARRLQFGNMILSRHPIVSIRTLLLPRSRSYGTLNLQRGALEAVVDLPGGPVTVYSVHLDHMSPDERIRQIMALRGWLASTPTDGTAVTGAVDFHLSDSPAPEDYIVLGDFNLQPGSPEYDALFGRRDAFYGRAPRRGHPVDALDHLGKRTDTAYSWQGPAGESERMLLDYAAVSASLCSRLTDAHIDTAATGSDHFPLWVELA